MNLIQALILGIVQGATEFLPISSSGHLVVVPWLFGWPQPAVVFDTIVHWGTLLAIVLYFRNDILALLAAAVSSLVERRIGDDPVRRMAWLIVVGSIPAIVLGVLLEKTFEGLFGQPRWVAVFMLVTGTVLIASEQLARRQRFIEGLGLGEVLSIGTAQAIAIAPGISRSGATIATGLALGLRREEAARFSFLLGAPIILGAGLFQTMKLAQAGASEATLLALGAGFIAAAITGYLCIRFLMAFLQQGSLVVFGIYCWLVGLGVLALSLTRGG